jgi:hypothetical protein
MCNAGCTVTFTKINCTIVYCGHTIVCGHKCTKTGLWMVPFEGSDTQATTPPAVSSKPTHPTAKPNVAIAVNVDVTSSAAKYARYIHQCICSPPSATLLGALTCSEELVTDPGLMPALIKNHLPRSTATDKEHIRRHRSNTTSTRDGQHDIVPACTEVDQMFPNTKFAPHRMYFVLLHQPTPSLAQCTPASLVHSLSNHSKVCSIFLLHMSMISMQSLCVSCPLVQMHPW